MARNRKRAKDRRAQRPPAGPAGARRGLATTRQDPAARPPLDAELESNNGANAEDAEPDAHELELNAPEADLAADEGPLADPLGDEDDVPSPLEHATPDAELADAALALGAAEAARPDVNAPAPAPGELLDEEGDEDEEDAALAETTAPGPARASGPRPHLAGRLAAFIEGSWRELQRVQWPDRRQVMQATGVVLGFVIVAGVFLGVSDFLAQKIVNFILK